MQLNKLSCCYTNAQGLTNKLPELRLRQATYSWDIICVTETWLSPEISDAEITLLGMLSIRRDRPSKGGGVIIYHRNDLLCEIIDQPETKVSDSLWCHLLLNGHDKCLLGLVYRPPLATPEMDNCLVSVMKFALKQNHTHVLITGDFNLHALDEPALPHQYFKAELQEIITTFPLYNHVFSPTRFRSGNKPSLLDLVFTNEELMIDGLLVDAPLGRSDHAVIRFNYICYGTYKDGQIKTSRTVTNYNTLVNLVSAHSWGLLNQGEVDSAWEEFVDTFNRLVANASEIKTSNPKRIHSFIRSRTRKWMNYRNSAWRLHRDVSNETTWADYVRLRNYCVKLVREDKLIHQQMLASKFCSNKKLLYQHINQQRKVQRGIPPLATPEGPTRTAEEAANALRSQYNSVFQYSSEFEEIQRSPNQTASLSQVKFTPDAVMKKLLKLRCNTSPGVDDINPRMLKETASYLAGPLACFFQRCFDAKTIPSMWKKGIISPIFKGGSRTDPANYRPVTLLPVLSKVMESIVADDMMHFLEQNNIIAPEQHGFRQRRSCTSNLLIARNNWTEAADKRIGVDAVYLDFSKAFDRVDHRILASKLQAYGIADPLLGWIEEFLLDRQLTVRVRGSFSDPIHVGCGVPQGSVLGPRLFLVFVNDLAKIISSPFLLFADDIKIWREINSESDHLQLQKDLDTVHSWSTANRMPLNSNKCKVLSLRQKVNTLTYKLGEDTLERVSQERDLGILIQEDLGCSLQSLKAFKTGCQNVGLLRRAFGSFDISFFHQLLNAYVRPHVEYAIQVWHPWLKRDITALEYPQRKATKNVRGLHNLSYEQRLMATGTYSGQYRRLRGDLIHVYQILRQPNHPCKDLLSLSHTQLRGHQFKLLNQHSRLDCRKHFFTLRVCQPWNNLPETVVNSNTLELFKQRLDHELSHLHYCV